MVRLETDLDGLFLFELDSYPDDRGRFMELYRESRYQSFGFHEVFVQDNMSVSRKGVLRGLHSQSNTPQGKLVTAMVGEIWDVVADVRLGSPTFGQWRSYVLSEQNRRQLYVPPGFLHGFCVLSEVAYVQYKVTTTHDPVCDFAVRWNDPELAIEWPIIGPILSSKDAQAPYLAEVQNRLSHWA